MKYCLLLWFALLLLPFAKAKGTELVVLRDTAHSYSLGRHWGLLPVRRGEPRLALAQVQVPPYSTRFRPSPEKHPRAADDAAEYWLRCQVRNETRAGTAWIFQAMNNPVDVYVVAPSGQVRHLQAGQRDHWEQSYAVPSRRFNLNLPLEPGQTYTVYVRSRSSLFVFDIVERTHLLSQVRTADVWACLYFGLLLGMIGYNLLLFLSVRDRSYLYYVLFTASFGALQLVLMGYSSSWWGGRMTSWQSYLLEHTMLALVMAFSILTTRSFLETRQLLPRFDRVLRGALALTPLPPLLVLLRFWPGVEWVSTALPLLVCGLLLAAGTWLLATGSRSARYYMAGWALLIGAIVVYYLRTLNIIPLSFLTEQGVRIASAMEVILLSMGLADRINRARRERHEAQTLALAALQEKETVQAAANQALAQRASELQQAYAELQASLLATGRLQEIDQLKTRFFTNISHELRTPLTLILGPLEQLLHKPEAAPLIEEHQLMYRHGQRLLGLLNQLLDIARLEAGQLRLQACPTDLADFVRVRVAAFDSLASSRGIGLAVRAPSQLTAYIDRDQLEKVLTNLLGNALKFTPSGGQVAVELAESEGQARLTVVDTGCGIPAAHLPLIFDRFHQVDDSMSRRHEGSGIGLALVKELVELHQGTVGVASVVGRGTTFTVLLPLGSAHLRPEEVVPAPADVALNEELERDNEESSPANSSLAEGEAPDGRPLVLVVDDQADMRAYVASCLGGDYRLATATEGNEGMALALDLGPDLVLSDVMMPGLDGLELCRRLKSDERTSHIPVVLLTARASDQGKLEGLELGADDYLTKPFRPRELQARVRNLIQQRQQLRQRFGREVTLQPRDISITSADEAFLTKALAVAEQHLAEPEFDVEAFAAALAMSRIQLYRKLKALTDQPPTEFVRTLRLRRAGQLLAAQAGNVADVAYMVGFNNLSYFSKCFREMYGHVPSEHFGRPVPEGSVPA